MRNFSTTSSWSRTRTCSRTYPTKIYIAQGLEAALIHLAEKNDLNEIEGQAVQATIEGLISAEQA